MVRYGSLEYGDVLLLGRGPVFFCFPLVSFASGSITGYELVQGLYRSLHMTFASVLDEVTVSTLNVGIYVMVCDA